MRINQDFEGLAFGPADILLPGGRDLSRWSVVACDQFTSQPEYWRETERIVGDAPSTLRLNFPEVYLAQEDCGARIERIDRTMRDYLARGVFREAAGSMVYVERGLKNGKIRRGLVGAVDLEAYDFHAGAETPVRATEGTVLERIPPRARIREGAALELPHVMLLIDDPEDTVLGAAAPVAEPAPLYDGDLMQGGGHITGRRLAGEALAPVARALRRLSDPRVFREKYGLPSARPLIFAVGDGNHSLATAKECYLRLKKKIGAEAAKRHPARYALCEAVNLHDASLAFEPIHRVLFGVDPQEVLGAFFRRFPAARRGEGPGHRFTYLCAGEESLITCEEDNFGLTVGLLQDFLDAYGAEHPGAKIDYIHGGDVARGLAARPGNAGFLLPALPKSALFGAVAKNGVLPRKTFSMGEACDKRYYLEARRIVE